MDLKFGMVATPSTIVHPVLSIMSYHMRRPNDCLTQCRIRMHDGGMLGPRTHNVFGCGMQQERFFFRTCPFLLCDSKNVPRTVRCTYEGVIVDIPRVLVAAGRIKD